MAVLLLLAKRACSSWSSRGVFPQQTLKAPAEMVLQRSSLYLSLHAHYFGDHNVIRNDSAIASKL